MFVHSSSNALAINVFGVAFRCVKLGTTGSTSVFLQTTTTGASGSIGTLAEPIRVTTPALEAHMTAAAGGKSFSEFNAKYVDGRDEYPWETVLPLAGMRLARDPRIGIQTADDSAGIRVEAVMPDGPGAAAGLKPRDYLVKVGDIEVKDPNWATSFRELYQGKAGAPLPIIVRRGGQAVTLESKVELGFVRVVEDPNAGEKAVRIRNGILSGK